jgi:hypothetical protein
MNASHRIASYSCLGPAGMKTNGVEFVEAEVRKHSGV